MIKKILILVDWYLPSYKGGGQIKAVEYIVENLKDRFDFYILCRDHDLDGTIYPDLRKNVWIKHNGVHIKYLSNKEKSYLLSVLEEIRQYEWNTIYMNSFFSLFFSIFPCFYIKLLHDIKGKFILAPRGEFSPGALNIKKLKKLLYIYIAKLIDLHKEIIWHASTEYEKKDIRKYFPDANVHIARELLPVVTQPNMIPIEKEAGRSRFLFLSRITNIKGLDYALRILQSITVGLIEFDIFGPIEDLKYWDECRALINKLPKNIIANYCGELPHNRIKDVIPNYHFLFFPTLGENFCYVIIEALLSCRPILISDRTPWRNLEENNIGYDISLDRVDLFCKKINEIVNMSQKEFDACIANVNNYAIGYVEHQKAIVKDSFELFTK